MRYLIGLIFAPWWIFIALSILTFGGGTLSYQSIQRTEANQAEALASPIPNLVELAIFNPKVDVTKVSEVNLAVQINTNYNFNLTQTSRKRADVERRMFVLFDRSDAGDAKIARAAILLSPDQVDHFVKYLKTSISGVGTYSAVYNINGKFSESAALDNMAEQAITENLGLKLSENFGYIRPFLQGREKAFAPKPNSARDTLAIFVGIGLLLLIVGVIKLTRSRNQPKVVGNVSATAPIKTTPTKLAESPKAPAPTAVQPRGFPVKSALLGLFLLVVLIRPTAIMTLFPLLVVAGVLIVIYGGMNKARTLGKSLLAQFGITQEGDDPQYTPKEAPFSSQAETESKPQRYSVLQKNSLAKRPSPKAKKQTGFSNGPVERITRGGLLSWFLPKPKPSAFDRLKQH